MFRELEVVVVRGLVAATRDVTGTEGVVRQPRVGDLATVVDILDAAHCTVECVNSSGETRWLADFHLDELGPDLEAWKFDVREVSSGVYRAVGSGPRGMRVEATDTDADAALADCRAFALRYPE
jgi:hypothetical protein